MQQRRYRPGDVLDDYCPRERRITDHAIVAMIDDRIKQTRCGVCDAEHEYKDGKVPPQRRKKPPTALFTQVLEGLQGAPAARLAHQPGVELDPDLMADVVQADDAMRPAATAHVSRNGHSSSGQLPANDSEHAESDGSSSQNPPPQAREDGPVRRPLIRATLPRPEGQPLQPTRAIPEFTIRQPNSGRGGHRAGGSGGRRRGGHQQGQGAPGPMRFGQSDPGRGQGQGQGQGQGRGPRQGPGHGQRPTGGRGHSPSGGRPGGPRRGGKRR